MGQREVWCSRAEHWGATHGVQGSALRTDRSSAGQTEGDGEGRHSEGTDTHNSQKSCEENTVVPDLFCQSIRPVLHTFVVYNKVEDETLSNN